MQPSRSPHRHRSIHRPGGERAVRRPETFRGSLHRVGQPTTLATMPLTERDKAILEFERTWWTEAGTKETAIRDHLELSTTRYYQILGELLESAEAMAGDPLVVRRLRRLRERRRRQRYEARPSTEWQGR